MTATSLWKRNQYDAPTRAINLTLVIGRTTPAVSAVRNMPTDTERRADVRQYRAERRIRVAAELRAVRAAGPAKPATPEECAAIVARWNVDLRELSGIGHAQCLSSAPQPARP